MIKFLDGPAKGVALQLQRAPIMLRVVQSPDGKWDALDQLKDVAADGEKIFVYRMEGTAGGAFVDGRDPKTGRRFGGYCVVATYRYLAEQPRDEEVRENYAWDQWCNANKERLLAGRAT